jgi:hypothetical protein
MKNFLNRSLAIAHYLVLQPVKGNKSVLLILWVRWDNAKFGRILSYSLLKTYAYR